VRYELERCTVHLARALQVASVNLLKQRVLDPEVYVSAQPVQVGLGNAPSGEKR
jgi:hypothetical protein